MPFDTLNLDPQLYASRKGFAQALEELDPSENYRGTPLEPLDAYERQLKRFAIRVSGQNSDRVEKFFCNQNAATLFPEYLARAVQQGFDRANKLPALVAATTEIDSVDYRSVANVPGNPAGATPEAEELPPLLLKSKPNLVQMQKFGRTVSTSYEALRGHRLDLLTVILRQVGAEIARQTAAAAVQVLVEGDGNTGSAAPAMAKNGASLCYADVQNLFAHFNGFAMTTLLVHPDTLPELLALPELRDCRAHDANWLTCPLGASIVPLDCVESGTLVGLDAHAALEMVRFGGLCVEHDKLVNRQLNHVAVSLCAGFSKIYSGSAWKLQ